MTPIAYEIPKGGSDSKKIYLAAPYSHQDPYIRKQRALLVDRFALALMERGFVVFSPLSHSIAIEAVSKQVHSWEFWRRQDLPFLSACDEVMVMCIPGWDTSVGIKGEIEEARKLYIPVTFIHKQAIDIFILHSAVQ